jgi:pyruvate dehydrogenase E2 component (dihydrolipoamide acetyltransferase)
VEALMLQEVLLPMLGETMEEATIERWIKKEGDDVKRGEVLLEITTDKATLEVESRVQGKMLKIIAQPGDVLPVNAVLAYVGEPGDKLPEGPAAGAAPAAAKPEAKRQAVAQALVAAALAPEAEGRICASPRARALAKAEAVTLEALRGSGPNGRIVEKDVQEYIQRAKAVHATSMARQVAAQAGVDITAIKGTGPGGRIVKDDVQRAAAVPAPASVPAGAGVEALTAMRRIVAERMTQSKREAPHFYLSIDADMTNAVAYRNAINQGRAEKIAFNDILIKACATAMASVPAVNRAWADGKIIRKGQISIGLAVALDEGLMVPVVRDADRKDIPQVAADTRALVEKARTKRLTPDECTGGSMTLSNLGMFGISSFYAVINPGESCILGVGAIVPKPVVIDGGLCVRQMMNLSLSCDHRVVDGAIGAQFLVAVKDHLEALQPPATA